VSGHDAIVHLATRIPRGFVRPFLPGAWEDTDRLRRDASRILVDAAIAAGVRQFVQESFALAYPDSGDRWVTEDTPIEPARYDHTVRDAEASAARFSGGGRQGVTLRFALLYGPDDAFTQQVFAGARRGRIPVLGRYDGYLPVVHHADAGAAVAAALGIPAGAYNVVDDEPLTRRMFASTIGEIAGVRPPKLLPSWLTKVGGSIGETLARSLRLSNAKLRSASSWRPEYPTTSAGWRDALQSSRSTPRRRSAPADA
jgi:nucleoside-diphosphate-sugar epimerase